MIFASDTKEVTGEKSLLGRLWSEVNIVLFRNLSIYFC